MRLMARAGLDPAAMEAVHRIHHVAFRVGGAPAVCSDCVWITAPCQLHARAPDSTAGPAVVLLVDRVPGLGLACVGTNRARAVSSCCGTVCLVYPQEGSEHWLSQLVSMHPPALSRAARAFKNLPEAYKAQSIGRSVPVLPDSRAASRLLANGHGDSRAAESMPCGCMCS